SVRCQDNARIAGTSSKREDLNLAEQIGESIVAYPNPVIDRINISISGMTVKPESSAIQIVDQIGKMYPVRATWNTDGHQLEIDFSEMNKGLYIIKIAQPQGVKVVKAFKE
ncbi:MAG TPA: T9SS type A sorting domain-containing protein, partial [Cyclobacteriaceae bacterium]|nr:T9SS type A sorting domain-containing protein [Cyclobacteriaceae bacterium]